MQDSDNLGNELNEDNNDIQGSAIFDETSENVVGEGFNDVSTLTFAMAHLAHFVLIKYEYNL